MAEKGTLITDQAGGTSVATRDAYELDGDSNARVIQRVGYSGLQLPDPLHTFRSGVTGGDTDPPRMDNLPANLTTNVITCGDKTTLVLLAVFATGSGFQFINIKPILFDNEVSPGVFMILSEQALDSNYSICRNADGTGQIAELKYWDITGASKIGIHVRSGTVTSTVEIYGGVI